MIRLSLAVQVGCRRVAELYSGPGIAPRNNQGVLWVSKLVKPAGGSNRRAGRGHPMSHRLGRALVSFVVLPFVVFSFAGLLAAQGRGPQSLQPDLSAVFITLAMRHDTPVARGNVLLLPSPSRRTIGICPGQFTATGPFASRENQTPQDASWSRAHHLR